MSSLRKMNIEDGYVSYSGSHWMTIKNILLGNVIIHQGKLYATPQYVEKLKQKMNAGK